MKLVWGWWFSGWNCWRWRGGGDGGIGGNIWIEGCIYCVIGDTYVSLYDFCLCDKEMFLNDGVIGDKNSKLEGSKLMEDLDFSWEFGTIPNGIFVPYDLDLIVEACKVTNIMC